MSGDIAIIGGTDIFGLFLPRYELVSSDARTGRHPAGRHVPFSHRCQRRRRKALLEAAGLTPGPAQALDQQTAISSCHLDRRPDN